MHMTFLEHPVVKKIVFLLTFLISLVLLRNFWQTWQMTPDETTPTTSIQELEQKKRELLEEMKNDSTQFSQEKTIRNELNMQKEGEIILQLPPLPTTTIPPQPTPTPTLKPIQAWKELIF